ncbi:MAG: endo-polygalacturonase, partial [Bacteroidetes bacterium]|nr:endo-polygalacturonase [Bacteroidota bacterium]
MLSRNLFRTILAAVLFYLPAHSQQLKVYDAPAAANSPLHNDDFSVRVRKPGGAWQDLYEYNVKVDELKDASHSVRDASMCSFDFSGEVELAVKSNKGNIGAVRVRPLSLGIRPKVKGNTLY